ncbi:MAG: hypothetical protein MUC91_14270, partial [Verrucomicrobia bacterium]|nr:hypothetical protein [Verrucomicrobiota bacterium]
LDNVRLSFDGLEATSIPLSIRQYGGDVVLSWEDASFILQTAADSTGDYTSLTEAASPYTNAIHGEQRFFRLIQGP